MFNVYKRSLKKYTVDFFRSVSAIKMTLYLQNNYKTKQGKPKRKSHLDSAKTKQITHKIN